jgi:hypothetical protein
MLGEYYAEAVARALQNPRALPSRMKVGEIRLETVLRVGSTEERETFVTPLWVRLQSSDYHLRKPREDMLFLSFKNTEGWRTRLLMKVFRKYSFLMVRAGVNRDGYWANFETKAKTLGGCLSIIERLRKDGILRDVRMERLYRMHAIAKLGPAVR